MTGRTIGDDQQGRVAEGWQIVGNVLLTAVLFGLVLGVAFLILYFAMTRTRLADTTPVPMSFALIPIFGACGGIVGSIITKENRIFLARFRNAQSLELGVVGNAITGLGGAAAVMFIFGISQFSIVPPSPEHMVVLVSITFLAGAFGPAVVQLLGKQFLKRLENLAREAARNESASVQGDLDRTKQDLGPKLYVQLAINATKMGNYQEALEHVGEALKMDSKYAVAYIEQGRAYFRLNRLEDALRSVDKALEINPENSYALYNRACYKLRRGDPPESALDDLKNAFSVNKELLKNAEVDKDLDPVRARLVEEGLLGAP